jgi:hypothetical protein
MRRLFLHRSLAATVISLIALFFAMGGTTVAATGASAAVAAASGWSIQSTPNPSGVSYSILHGVSCASAGACTAVGEYGDGTSDVTLAEGWNGSTWSIQPTPNPAGGSNITLYGVSCASASACTAVGGSSNGTTMVTLAERWNGTKWSIQHTPNPTGSSFTFLYGVSCTSVSACTAVGTSSNGTLAERWNGTTWSIQHTPNPTGGSGILLQGVSCASASACTAVGGYSKGTAANVTLAERWNGTTWSIQHTPNPTGAQGSGLGTVSCTSASACTAVGAYNTGPTTGGTLAERWNGSTWSIQHTPNPAGGSSIVLGGVSCASATACTAVGDYNNGTTGVTLAERWNGSTWSIQPTPNPAGAPVSLLNGVSCASATACTAVGGYNNGTAGVTLAERWNG